MFLIVDLIPSFSIHFNLLLLKDSMLLPFPTAFDVDESKRENFCRRHIFCNIFSQVLWRTKTKWQNLRLHLRWKWRRNKSSMSSH
jgi:hypothetical protein